MGMNLTYDLIGTNNIDITDIKHTIINYVDNSTNIISSKCPMVLKKYIDTYYMILEQYYNINFLLSNTNS